MTYKDSSQSGQSVFGHTLHVVIEVTAANCNFNLRNGFKALFSSIILNMHAQLN